MKKWGSGGKAVPVDSENRRGKTVDDVAFQAKRLLDSLALLAYLNEEDGFEKVRSVLTDAQKSNSYVIMNELNVGET